MKFRQLEYFVQIVDSGSFVKASRLLHVVQPALSQQLANLEEEIGKKLLIRSSKGISVTENGAALYQHAKFVLRQMEQAVKVARQDASEISGVVAVGLAPSTACAIGFDLLCQMRQKYPGITLNIVEGMSGHLGNLLRNNQLDLAVRFTKNTESDLDVEFLVEEEMAVIVPHDSVLVPRSKKSISLEEASRLPLLLPTASYGHRQIIAIEMERLGISVSPIGEIDSISLLMACVSRGVAATIQPMSAALVPVPGAKLRCVKLEGGRLTRKNYLYSLPDSKLSRSAALVREEMKVVVNHLVHSGQWPGSKINPDVQAA